MPDFLLAFPAAMRARKWCGWIAVVAVGAALGFPVPAAATPEFSARTEQGCLTCHRDAEGGGALATTGLRFAAAGCRWPPMGGYRVLGTMRRSVRLLVRLSHIVAAFLWFGTILSVRLMLRPAYASKGIPRGEVLLGFASTGVVGVTGALPTASRIAGLEVLFDSLAARCSPARPPSTSQWWLRRPWRSSSSGRA